MGGGTGLIGLHDRVTALGGELELRQPGGRGDPARGAAPGCIGTG